MKSPPHLVPFYEQPAAGRIGPGKRTPWLAAAFLERPNRFLVIAGAGGRRVRAASRDPGRLRELLRPGAKLLLVRSTDPRRRTGYTVALVRHARAWVSLVPVLANRILAAALECGAVPGLEGARLLRREPAHGRSRFDFLLEHEGRELLTEVKSATLVEQGLALFPDAPSARATRHVRDLTAWQRRGGHSLVVFVVQRSDARGLSPHAANDPEFEGALAEAAGAGVRILAYTCRVGPHGCALDRRIPVVIRGHPARIRTCEPGRCCSWPACCRPAEDRAPRRRTRRRPSASASSRVIPAAPWPVP